jgi:hypothetical protein
MDGGGSSDFNYIGTQRRDSSSIDFNNNVGGAVVLMDKQRSLTEDQIIRQTQENFK